MQSTDLDSFLISLPDDELLGHNEDFDCVQHAVSASENHTKGCCITNPVRTVPSKLSDDNYERSTRCLAFLPTEVIKETMDCTTRFAKLIAKLP